jgi:hypothetical protein
MMPIRITCALPCDRALHQSASDDTYTTIWRYTHIARYLMINECELKKKVETVIIQNQTETGASKTEKLQKRKKEAIYLNPVAFDTAILSASKKPSLPRVGTCLSYNSFTEFITILLCSRSASG